MSQMGKFDIVGDIDSFTGNIGGAVGADGIGNVNLVGAEGVTVTGTPGTNTLTITTAGVIADQFTTDAGNAFPDGGILNVVGGINISTQAPVADGDTVQIDLDGIVPVASGGTGANTLTDHAVLVGAGVAAVTTLGLGTANQVLQSGGAAADPDWSTATYPATSVQGDVIYSSADNTIEGLAKDATATRYLANTGATNNPAWDQVELTNGVSGILPVGNGGTGVNTLVANGILIGNGAGAVNVTGAGVANQVLISGGPGVDPTWQDNVARVVIDGEIAPEEVNVEEIFISRPNAWLRNIDAALSSEELNCIAYDGATDWVIGGLHGKISTALDPTGAWTNRANPFNASGDAGVFDVKFANAIWVAVGGRTFVAGEIATALDPTGVWTLRANPFGTSVINGVAYDGTTNWVAVGWDGKLATSPNSINWTLRTSSFGSSHIWKVTFGAGLWVAVGAAGKIATATQADPTTWTQRANPFGTSAIYNIAYDGATNWTAVGAFGKIATTLDPTGVWTLIDNPFPDIADLAGVAYYNGYWVAVGKIEELVIAEDPNVDWDLQPSNCTALYNVTHGDGYWAVVGHGSLATCADPAEGIRIADRTIAAEGSAANININITPKGTGVLATTELTLTTPLAVPYGGTGLAAMTDHGLLLGSGATDITPLAEAADGQIPIGSTGNDPVLAVIASAGGTVDITNAAGSINLEAAGSSQIATGFATWIDAGAYYDDTTLGEFDVLRGGTGYIKGVPISWTGPQTVAGMTAGNNYLIYMDDTGTIGKTTAFVQATFEDYIVLFECLRDSTAPTNNQITVKENHPYEFPVATSFYNHEIIGTLIDNNLNGANITLNGTQKIEIVGADLLSDHGLYTTIPDGGGTASTFNQMYTNAGGKWALHSASDTFDGYYNNAGTPTALGANKFAVYTLYVSKDDINAATPVYFAVLNTSQYNNLTAARTAISNATTAKQSAELLELELAQLGYIIYAEATSTIVDVIIAKSTLKQTLSTAGSNVASLIITSTTNFDGILSAGDTTVQSALDTIDEWGKTTTDHAVLIGNGTGSAIGSLAVGADNEVLLGNTGADASWGAVGNAALTNSSVTLSDGNNITVTGSPLSLGGTASFNLTGTTQYALQVGDATGSLDSLGVGTASQILQSGGAGANPAWSTATYPATAAIGTILIASGANTITTLAPDTAGHVLTDGGAGVAPSWVAPTTGTVTSVSGGTNITDSGTASDPVMDLDATITLTTVNATTFDTNVAAAAVTLAGTSLVADGTDANIDINITAKGTGQVIIDDLQLTADLTVPYGGTGASSFTDGGVLVGATAGPIEALGVGGTGTILTGVAASNPTWTTATYPATATKGDIISASEANVFTAIGAGTNDHVLTANGAGEVSTYQYSHALPITIATKSDSYAIVLGDEGKLLRMNKGTAQTVTVPKDATSDLPIGSQILVFQSGAGATTIAAEDGTITLEYNTDYTLVLDGQFSTVALIKTAANKFLVGGDLTLA